MIIEKLQHSFFLLRIKYIPMFVSSIRMFFYGLQGMKIGKGTFLPSVNVTWPHQVKIGNFCQIEKNTNFKFDGIWKSGPSILIGDNVFIGANCEFNVNVKVHIQDNSLIASGCKFIDHDHGTMGGIYMRSQQAIGSAIVIGEDVWLGVNVVVLKGVTIGTGSIVAAGAIVNRSIPDNQIWGGVPAKFIKART
jgi:acetyltransferase-like isoleucine patch superfamily enzyme